MDTDEHRFAPSPPSWERVGVRGRGAHPATAPDTAGVIGAPDSDPARFDKIPIHAGSESGAPGAGPGCPRGRATDACNRSQSRCQATPSSRPSPPRGRRSLMWTGATNLECGDLSPLLLLWRLVAKAGSRSAARQSRTPRRIRRRQVACRKRGQVRALQSGCGFAALGSSVSIRGFNWLRALAMHAAFFILAAPVAAAAPKVEPAGLEFFERHIRPLLVEHCYKCHSAQAEKLKGGLLLDTREGVLKGGDTGPAILPGDPDKSLLIKAVRYTDPDLQMPPAKSGGKLSDEQIHHLEAWVKMGAPDPRDGKSEIRNPKSEITRHWAFRPVQRPPLPGVKSTKLVQTPVDNFVLAKLEAKGLTFSPRADKRTLIRRASYDLTGLPPTLEEVRAFEKDHFPDAFAKVVDRLLASPRYGERWGRYWLDVARYADTKGYVFEEERKYPYSYTYRDWVIRAFNEDLPYDQFLVQQLAADLLPLGEDKRPLAALGFLTLGRRFLNNPPDIIDDRIDVVCRGTMGLTVTCARCHDHKFDPITMKDYYGLYGVFASSHEPKDEPLLGSAAMPPQYAEYVAERKKRQAELEDFVTSKEEEVRTKLRAQVGDYLLVVHDAAQADEEKREGLVRERKLQPSLARNYQGILKDWEEEKNPIFTPWFAFAALPKTNFAEKAKEVIAGFTGETNPSNGAKRTASPPPPAPPPLRGEGATRGAAQ